MTPTRTARLALLAAGVALAGPGAALAQQPAPPAAPRGAPRPATPAPAAPAAPAPAAAAPAGPTRVAVKPEPSQADWLKVCGKDQAAGKEICYTTRDFVEDKTNTPVLAVAVYDVKGDGQKIVRFLLPLGFMIAPGMRFGVDQAQPSDGKFAICFPNGCFAEAPVREDLVNQMKRGTNLNLSIRNQVNQEVSFAVPLAGFGKAYDGAPIDPAVLEAQQKALQDELQKRGEEMRRQQVGGAAGAAPAPPAPAAGGPAAGAPGAPRP